MDIRFFKKSERQLLLDSIDRLWSHEHVYVRKPEVLEHLVLNTPYRVEFAGEDKYSYVGMWDDDGKIVGIYGSIPQKFNIFGIEYNSESATTWLVDKTCGKHINGLALRDFCYNKNIKAAVYFGLSNDAYRINTGYGAYMTKDFPRWIGIQQKEAVQKYLLPDGTPENILPEVCLPVREKKYNTEIDKLREDAWNEFYYKKFAKVTIGTQRDYRFLKWRYMESPILTYKIIAVTDDSGDYHGLAVVRREKILDGTIYLGRIVEFIALDAEASIELATAVVEAYFDVAAWDFYCLSDITSYGLEMIGFRRVPSWMDYVLLPTRFQPIDYEHMKINGAVYIDEKLRWKLNQMTNIPWYLTRGDSDQDRAN